MEEKIKILQPIVSTTALSRLEPEALSQYFELAKKANNPYLHWDKLRFKSWVPADKETFWSVVKLNRKFLSVVTPIVDNEGKYFTMNAETYTELLHTIDVEMAGNFMGLQNFSESDRQQFIERGRIEEAIASSQLEGANTARRAAKQMLMEGRAPQTHGERMIVNNHAALTQVEEDWKNEPLSIDLLLEMHRFITKDTLPKAQQGILRNTYDEHGEPLVVTPFDDRKIAYTTPPKEFVEAQLPRLIAFANDQLTTPFIHPIIKGILLHFWIGLLHPFEDGNGRVARCIFYWYVLRHNYWAFSYLALTEGIIKSSKQYAWAYIYSEQDDNDLNYFIDYNMRQIHLARVHLKQYLERKVQENRSMVACIKQDMNFNQRQINLLQYLAKHEQDRTSLAIHAKINKITPATASADLHGLMEKELLVKRRQGKYVFYYPTPRVRSLFRYN